MMELEVEIIELVDSETFPYVVKCILYDAFNKKHIFIDKIVAFSNEWINPNDFEPCKGVIRCELIKSWQDELDRKMITVNTIKPDGLESVDGLNEFDVLEIQQLF